MKLISFDIGIKNMAYCIFNITPNAFQIVDWAVMNLSNATSSQDPIITGPICTCSLKNKKPCGKKAVYEKDTHKYCSTHSKTSGHLFPSKDTSDSAIRKMKKDELIAFCISQKVFNAGSPEESLAKPAITELACIHMKRRTLVPIVSAKKKKNASEINLITIGRNMKTQLDNVSELTDITHVIIENQISPIANRMKTIQGMLSQYFIMKFPDSVLIDFISSANKLKGFEDFCDAAAHEAGQDISTRDSTNYKQHKKDGILVCSTFLNNNDTITTWKKCMETSKKDDYADAFLQGIWYMKSRKIISYAENLKINIVC